MGRKSRKKGKPKKPKPDFSDYEGFSYGPLKIERFGREIRYSSHWKPGQHKKHMEYIRDKRPEFKKEINEKISEILTLADKLQTRGSGLET